MARVFLSYDRDDAGKARAIAEALENAGHVVWWDFHIRGGAEFSKEIEQALADADAVVVLWSNEAIESGWVRDEAAAGRDRGRLVPVRLDEARPPLGFRQYQCIDLSAWKGRGGLRLDDLFAAIEGVTGGQAGRRGGQESVSTPASHKSTGRSIPLLSAIAALIAAATTLTALFWQPWRAKHDPPSVAVLAAQPNRAADSLAADLLVKLGVLQSLHADALQLVDVDSQQTPDFIIKVGSASADRGAPAHLMLVDNRAGTLLWSREFTQPDGNQADLRQQMAYSAAQVMDCAVEALSSKDQTVKLPTLKLYLSGCADLSNLLAQDPRAGVSIFAKVAELAPKFKGAWKKLLLADVYAIRFGGRSDPLLERNLKGHLTQARRLNPSMAEAFLAEAWLRPPRPIAGWMKLVDRAVAEDPDNPHILTFHSIALTNVGRMQEALDATRRAVKSNPLSPSARDALITALLNSDQVEAARNELGKAEQLWPGATNVLESRFAVEFRIGDAARALAILQSGQLGAAFPTNTAHETYLKARIEPTPKNKEIAIVNARALYGQDPTASWVYARALSDFGGHEELIDFLLSSDVRIPYTTTWVIFRPEFTALHLDPRFMVIAKRFGVLDYWQDTGKWPDFCGRPDLPYNCKAEAAKLI